MEVVVHLLVGSVDAELLQAVVAQVLEAEDVQQANGGAIRTVDLVESSALISTIYAL